MRLIARCILLFVLTARVANAQCTSTPQLTTGNCNGWADAGNTRFQPAAAAGLTSQTTPKLKVKWAFGFPGVMTGFGVPSIVDGRLYVGANDGSVYSLDARTG